MGGEIPALKFKNMGIIWLNKNASVDKEVFENKTREEQIDFVSNLQEYKFLHEAQKKQKVKEVLNGIGCRDKSKNREVNANKIKTGSGEADNSKQTRNRSKKSRT